jgi:anti-sigma regulatory factor (Ser/Thr protein kinase)
MPQAPLTGTAGCYRHEALLYSGTAEFLAGTMSFIRRAISGGDPILVVLSRPKIDMLRGALPADAGTVSYADMAEVGDNPARIIGVWRAFLRAHPGARQLYGIGEPVYPERSPTELAECHLHEALLNVAFDAATPFWLLCPYDLEALATEVIDEAGRTHPFVAQGDDRQPCRTFQPIDPGDPFDRPLPARPQETAGTIFEAGGLRRIRAFVAEQARQAGLAQERAAALVQAVNEIATNSVSHGGGRGELRVWTDDHSLICQVSDHGHITAPLVGRLPPVLPTGAGGGLWLANQLCDLVQIYSSPDGTTVRVRQNL